MDVVLCYHSRPLASDVTALRILALPEPAQYLGWLICQHSLDITEYAC